MRTVAAELNDSPTALKIAEALPIETSFSTWGDEIYFAIPVDAPLEETARPFVFFSGRPRSALPEKLSLPAQSISSVRFWKMPVSSRGSCRNRR